jgi:ribokinase
VFGSINIDIFLKIDRQPLVGETMTANEMKMGYGGKGANQAVACARLGAETTLLGQIGVNDPVALGYLKWLENEGVNVSNV